MKNGNARGIGKETQPTPLPLKRDGFMENGNARGIGLDIVDISMFQEQLQDPASSFVEGTFTSQERDTARQRPGNSQARHLAARFAAKEAFLKAWSCAIWGEPPVLSHVDMREIEVICDPWNRPALRFHGSIAKALAPWEPLRTQLSLSHDGGVAAAIVHFESIEGKKK